MANTTAQGFLRQIYGNVTGVAWLARIDRTGNCVQNSYEYPDDLDDAVAITDNHKDKNVYFCVNTTTSRRRQSSEVRDSNLVYADLDATQAAVLKHSPTFVTETSPARYQAFWVLDAPVDARTTSEISRRIASYHKLDACWDTVRLMRLPGTYNHKYDDPFQVHIVSHTTALYRPTDFKYPEVKLRYITQGSAPEHVPRYVDLDDYDKLRVTNYTEKAVEDELIKLDLIADLNHGQRYEYHTARGVQEFGWERGCMWVARCLVELANAPWNNYTLDNAYIDFMKTAPTDEGFTKNDLNKKWQSALNANREHVKFRAYPANWEL